MSSAPTMEVVQPKTRSEAIGSIEDAISRLIRTVRTTLSDNASAFSPGLTPTAYSIMGVIDRMHPITPAAIIEATGIDKSLVSRQLRVLKDGGYVTSAPDPHDRRADLFSPTAEAEARFSAIRSQNRARFSSSFDSWSEDEVDAFATLLDKFIRPAEG